MQLPVASSKYNLPILSSSTTGRKRSAMDTVRRACPCLGARAVWCREHRSVDSACAALNALIGLLLLCVLDVYGRRAQCSAFSKATGAANWVAGVAIFCILSTFLVGFDAMCETSSRAATGAALTIALERFDSSKLALLALCHAVQDVFAAAWTVHGLGVATRIVAGRSAATRVYGAYADGDCRTLDSVALLVLGAIIVGLVVSCGGVVAATVRTVRRNALPRERERYAKSSSASPGAPAAARA